MRGDLGGLCVGSKKKTKRLAKAVGRGATDGEDFFASPAAVTPTMIKTQEELDQENQYRTQFFAKSSGLL